MIVAKTLYLGLFYHICYMCAQRLQVLKYLPSLYLITSAVIIVATVFLGVWSVAESAVNGRVVDPINRSGSQGSENTVTTGELDWYQEW